MGWIECGKAVELNEHAYVEDTPRFAERRDRFVVETYLAASTCPHRISPILM